MTRNQAKGWRRPLPARAVLLLPLLAWTPLVGQNLNPPEVQEHGRREAVIPAADHLQGVLEAAVQGAWAQADAIRVAAEGAQRDRAEQAAEVAVTALHLDDLLAALRADPAAVTWAQFLDLQAQHVDAMQIWQEAGL